jgi:hypothetical protein
MTAERHRPVNHFLERSARQPIAPQARDAAPDHTPASPDDVWILHAWLNTMRDAIGGRLSAVSVFDAVLHSHLSADHRLSAQLQ